MATSNSNSNSDRLHRSSDNKFVFGVAGGIAEYFDVDPVIVRIAFVLFAFANGLGLLIYFILALIMPKEDSTFTEPRDVARENFHSMVDDASEAIRGSSAGNLASPNISSRRNIFALLLIAVGALWLLSNLGLFWFWWFKWSVVWPVALIGIGAFLLYRRSNNSQQN